MAQYDVRQLRMTEMISPHRMSTYLKACQGDYERAFDLYRLNADLTAVIQTLTGFLEVLTRNAIDSALTKYTLEQWEMGDWFELTILDSQARADIRKSRTRLERHHRNHANTLANLSFGFWKYLVAKRYLTTLWIPAIRHAFPHGPRDPLECQQVVFSILNDLVQLRNRAAHLEPVFYRRLAADYEQAYRLVCFIDSDAGPWLAEMMAPSNFDHPLLSIEGEALVRRLCTPQIQSPSATSAISESSPSPGEPHSSGPYMKWGTRFASSW